MFFFKILCTVIPHCITVHLLRLHCIMVGFFKIYCGVFAIFLRILWYIGICIIFVILIIQVVNTHIEFYMFKLRRFKSVESV